MLRVPILFNKMVYKRVMALKIESVFPTQIGRGRLNGASALNPKILAELKSLTAQDKMGKQWSAENYRGGYTSYGSLSDLHHRFPVFSTFSERLQPHANAFAKKQGWDLRGLRLEMTHCWINIMPKHTYHTLHHHPHSVLSGAYYVSAPRGSVALKLEDPRMALYMSAPVREGLYYEVKPAPGSFILFESWLRHEVPPNQSNAPRVSLSFNYALEGV